ncbi:MAG: SRPBCC family protein [Solirubrobacteraceae bacterium]|nr:SRPBCC family protein [Solirubrobacteraceae bacterium]
MHLSQDVIIDAPIAQVAELLADPQGPRKWHRDLQSIDLKRGTAGTPGAVSELTYLDKGRTFKVTETIVSLDLPRQTVSTYKGPGMLHTLTTTLKELGPSSTRVTVDNDIKLSGVAKFAGPVISKGTAGQMKHRAEDLKTVLEGGSLG